jgi:outer membrane protein insertion porin family
MYRPTRAIDLQFTTGDDNDRSYQFRHERLFGGTRPDATRERTVRPPQPRIDAIRIAVPPDEDEQRLRRLTGLEVGERFDFYEWQEGRDRLLRRVRARRGEDGSVEATTLQYDIERGPRTTIEVEGAALGGDLIEQMREAWSEAVFDGFLLEDLEVLARRDLLERGYAQAEVETMVTASAADAKTILVRIDPGRQFADRRIAFAGQSRVSSAELRQVLDARDLIAAAWLRPEDTERAIEDHYRQQGFLSATATVEAPVFEGDAATLPLRIDEGPQFRIGTVSIAGARARPEAQVGALFGLSPDQPYRPETLAAARRRVETDYLRAGYHDVRVSVDSTVDLEAGTAHLVLAVDEGPRHVLTDVDVTGAATTARSAIDRALDLTIGEPIDLNDTYRAQKRLYDTGVLSSASVTLEPAGGVSDGMQPVRAHVSVQEVPLYRLRYGFRVHEEVSTADVGREVRTGLVVDLLRRNLFGRAVAAGLAGQVERNRWLVRGIVSSPSMLGLPLNTSLYLTRSRQDFNEAPTLAYINDLTDVTAEQRFRVGSSVLVSYNYRFTRLHSFPAGEESFAVPFDSDTARLTASLAWDRRDDPFNSASGWFHSSTVEYAAAALGSDLRFLKYAAQQYYFRPVTDRGIVLASAARLGLARGIGQDLIPSERFVVGGATSVRGFPEDEVRGRDLFGPIGGNASIILNQEVRFPVYRWFRGIGFLDAGNVFPRARELSVRDLEAGTGAGLRIDTPFGLARIDMGIPLTNRDTARDVRWYFGIGQAF